MDLTQLQREMADMSGNLMKKIEKCESNIRDHLQSTLESFTSDVITRSNTLERNLKEYINSVVLDHITFMVSQIPSVLEGTHSASPVHNTQRESKSDADNKISSEQPTTPNLESSHHIDQETIQLQPADLQPSQPIHDVYIGGVSADTTEDTMQKYLIQIGIKSSSIVSLSRVSNPDSTASSFRVKICEKSIKDNVYNTDNFKYGIVVKPFRYYTKDNMKKTRDTYSVTNRMKSDPKT